MPITTKKYIPVDDCVPDDDNGNYGSGLFATEDCIVELPDLSNASDIEKLEWVLKDIGYPQVKIDNKEYKMDNSCNVCVSMKFDANGKLIK